MSSAKVLVTGGSGFIGSGLVKALVRVGNRVRAFDNNSRGNARRLAEVAKDIEFIEGDIRDLDALIRVADGIDEMHHLAFVNGTTYFYEVPELVLDVGVRGMTNVIEACRRRNIATLIVVIVSAANATRTVMTHNRTQGASSLCCKPSAQAPARSFFLARTLSSALMLSSTMAVFSHSNWLL